jgi:hypothetical protein
MTWLKRNLWCRFFHHWKDSPYGGQVRRYCAACPPPWRWRPAATTPEQAAALRQRLEQALAEGRLPVRKLRSEDDGGKAE